MEATQVERALDEGRRLVDAGELRGALVPLERARQEFLRAGDLEGLRQVRRAVEEAYTPSAPSETPSALRDG